MGGEAAVRNHPILPAFLAVARLQPSELISRLWGQFDQYQRVIGHKNKVGEKCPGESKIAH